MEGLEATRMPEGHQETVERVRAAMSERGLAQVDVARQSGLSAPVLSEYLAGKHRGRNDGPKRKLDLWIAGLANADRLNVGLDRVGDTVETPTARKIEDLCIFAKTRGVIGVVAGATGIGKSTALRQVAARHGRVWYCELMRGEGRTVPSILRALGRAIGVYNRGQYSDGFARAVAERLAGTRGLLIIDEAQHSRGTDTFEELRSIFDKTAENDGRAVGMVLAGHLNLADKIAALPHLDGRVGSYLTLPSATETDVDALCDHWELTCAKSRHLLRSRARDRMGLRRVVKVYELAVALAAREGVDVDYNHIRSAFASFSTIN